MELSPSAPRTRWFFTLHSSRIVVVVKVESYRLTFTNNQKRGERRRRRVRRHADMVSHVNRLNVAELKGVPLVSVAWFRVPLLYQTVRERLWTRYVNSFTMCRWRNWSRMWTKAPRSTGKPERLCDQPFDMAHNNIKIYLHDLHYN